MENLENLNLVELKKDELVEIEGGMIILLRMTIGLRKAWNDFLDGFSDGSNCCQ
ncbi:MAG: hypothetical protein GDA51_06660 [Ekhidna sp.]|nr:hypothetical protein [Ekhidna sp.]